MATATRLLSYQEWLELPENDEGREECVNGVIEKMPPAKWKDAIVVERLTRQLWKKLDERTTEVISSDFALIIRKNPVTQRTPDIAVFLRQAVDIRDGYIHSAPELAVEVLSPSNTPGRVRDKLADYASINLPEVWIVNPNNRTVAVQILEAGGYRESIVNHDAVTTPVRFPSVTVDFSTIWQ